MEQLILCGARVFDGTRLHDDRAVVIEGDRIAALAPLSALPDSAPRVTLDGGVIAPGLVDLQVNGGGGVMLDGTATVEQIRTICAAHARLGATSILPTLITDTAGATRSALAAGIAAVPRVPGFAGMHLEGPHLDPRRAGAHDPTLIRPMDQDDLETLLEAKTGLPALIVTLAPGAATPEQIRAMTDNGILISLGHSDCTRDEAETAHLSGARLVTHLFNAMSQLGSREPGLVGAALSLPLHAGLIADGIHVHPETIRLALQAKTEGEIFLISDAMACAGTDQTAFTLGGRRILRQDGSLRLETGTLAGADLSLPDAIRFMVTEIGLPPERALAMASRIPADLIGSQAGRIAPGLPADLIHLGEDWHLAAVWQAGKPLAQPKSSTA